MPRIAHTAVAAAVALLAAVIVAAVLRAVHTNLVRWLVADAADESQCLGHFFSNLFTCDGRDGVTGACRINAPRHRCASWSNTWYSCSRDAARSIM